MMNKNGMLIVISAPSGCGKGTLLSEILKEDGYYYSISATTRAPREGERDGVNYHYMSREDFEKTAKNGGMLEYAEYCGNLYGTPLTYIEENLGKGKKVILEIETKGAMKVKELHPEAVLIFILPPSVKELRRRLESRETETAEVVERRIAEGIEEIKKADKYDYIMVNDNIDKAVEDLKKIIAAAEMSRENNKHLIEEVLENA